MTPPRGPQPFPGQEKRLRLLAFVRQDSVVRVDKRVEDTAMVWPHLLVIEFIAMMIWALGLFAISALFNAPLQDHSTVDCTPNPSKAPWYLLNLQELLLHMDKGLAGVIVPTIWLTFMAAIPYIDRDRAGIGHWFTNAVGKRITIFSAVFTGVVVSALIAIDAVIKVDRRVTDAAGAKTGWPGYAEFASQFFPGGRELIPNYAIPIAVMLILPVVLVMLVKRLFGGGTREWMIAIYTGFVVTFVVLTVVGTSLRGPGMDLYAPWALPKLISASRRRSDDVIRPHDDTSIAAGGMLSRIKRRQLLRIGFLTGTLLALTEFSAAILPFLWVLKIEGLGAKITAGTKKDILAKFQASKDEPQLNQQGRFFLIHGPGAIAAAYVKCTHLGCTVPYSKSENQFHCPCHGSLYEKTTALVIGGPAPRGLDLFNVSETATGAIIVDTNPLNVLKRPNNQWDPAHVQVTDA